MSKFLPINAVLQSFCQCEDSHTISLVRDHSPNSIENHLLGLGLPRHAFMDTSNYSIPYSFPTPASTSMSCNLNPILSFSFRHNLSSCLSFSFREVDRMLLSWLHCELPFGTLDFATLIILMGPSTDAPHILFEFPILQGAKITVVIDLLPRKDLAADVEYLDRIYGNTALAQLHKQVGAHCFAISTHLLRHQISTPNMNINVLHVAFHVVSQICSCIWGRHCTALDDCMSQLSALVSVFVILYTSHPKI